MSVDIRAPEEQEGTKSVFKAWLKKLGDPVRADEPIAELETDKVAVEIASPGDGVLAEMLVEPDAEVEPGMVLGRIAEGAAMEKATAPAPAKPEAAAPAAAGRIPPGIRKLLADHGLSESDIEGPLTREAIQAEAERRSKGGDAAPSGVTRVPHDSMRRRIAEHMTRSVTVAPHVTAVFEADMSAVAAHREAHKQGRSLTYTAYFVKAAALAMKAAPSVNGRWFDDRIEIYDDVNIGVGTALGDKGLVVPVVQRTQALSLFEIADAVAELTAKAREGRLAPAEMRGGTFSISNHGTSGSLIAAPIIINQPQAAILGLGKLEKRAVVRGDAVVIRPMAYVTLTIDHRMLDGHQTNAWLTRFVAVLEGWPAE